MTDDNVDVTKKGYEAFSAVDLEAALSASASSRTAESSWS
jgi:hypothetical protein